MTRERSDLARLATSQGIHMSFRTGTATHHADHDVVLALLRALGVPIERAAEAKALGTELERASLRDVVAPVLTFRTGRRANPAVVTLPSSVDIAHTSVVIELENGGTTTAPLVRGITGMERLDVGPGATFHRYVAALEALAEAPLPLGYHSLHVDAPGLRDGAPALLVSAPRCPSPARGWGLFMPVHAIRTEHDWGVGSYTDLERLGRWAGGHGASFLGGLPLYPIFTDHPIDPSPYRPVSRLAHNEVFVDPEAAPEFASSGADRIARDLGATSGSPRPPALVDYEGVWSRKEAVLSVMSRALHERPSARLDELDAFASAHPEVAGYAQFRAARDHRRGAGPTGTLEERTRFYLYCQWLAHSQLEAAARALPLYADFPLGVHPDGYDACAFAPSFLSGVQAGAPPDEFFAGGQSWAFPPLHPHGVRRERYRYPTAALRRALRHASYLRIDHILGFERMYMIPDGADAAHGAYVSYEAEEWHALVSLEAHRAGTVVIGEDLGTVPPGVRRRMQRDGMLRSWVFQFESSPADPLPAPPPGVVASLGTHDLPRFGPWFRGTGNGSDGDAERGDAMAMRTQRRKSLVDALGIDGAAAGDQAVLEGCLLHLAASDAAVVLADLEELWGEDRPQNRPGTGPEADNWRGRARRTLEDLSEDEALGHLVDELSKTRSVG
ncbi:MAG TPA: 4-alpha-glucanotransferase [Acidimicrobiales bacterium]|nr:4-alpha-glucanotransferase [Acidimicrobiales bacterium]